MEEESSTRDSGNISNRVISRVGSTRRKRYVVDESGDRIECSGRHCRSCTAALIADCVALCCCPCAVVNFLAFTFVKVPWMVGRKCLGLEKKKGIKKRKCKISEDDSVVDRENDGNNNEREWKVEEGMSELFTSAGFAEQVEQIDFVSARFEAEKVWLELYQVGQFGFGRHSSSG